MIKAVVARSETRVRTVVTTAAFMCMYRLLCLSRHNVYLPVYSISSLHLNAF